MTHIVLDSFYKSEGDYNNCSISLARELKNVNKICILNCHIPNTFYIFNSNNYTIYFNEGGGTLSGNLPEGSYDENVLAGYLKTLLDTAGALTYTVTYLSDTNKFQITSTGAWNLLCSTAGFPYRELGFNNTDVASVGASNTITSDNTINLNPIQYLTVNFDNLPLKSIVRGGRSIVGHFAVPILSDSFSFNVTSENSVYQICFSRKIPSIRHINVRITPPNGNYTLRDDWVIILKVYES